MENILLWELRMAKSRRDKGEEEEEEEEGQVAHRG